MEPYGAHLGSLNALVDNSGAYNDSGYTPLVTVLNYRPQSVFR